MKIDLKVNRKFLLKDYSSNIKLKKDFQNLAFLNQVHGDKIVKVEKPGYAGKADGLFTKKVDLKLGVRVADCNAIYLWDENLNIIMILHAGWRGTVKNILLKGINIFRENDIASEDINIYISPSARKCCYEVQEDFIKKLDFKLKNFVIKSQNKYFFNMLGLNISTAGKNGVKNISYADDCTVCSEKYFSYRENRTEKRHLAYIEKIKK